MVRLRPRTPQELASIKGLGPARLERYGAALLAAVAEAGELPPTVPPQRSAVPSERAAFVPRPSAIGPSDRPVPPPHHASATYIPTEEWTWRLLDRGFTLDEAAAIRGLDQAAIIRHAALMARQGRLIAVETFLTPDVIRRWDAWRAEHGNAPPPLERGISADLWALFLACRTTG